MKTKLLTFTLCTLLASSAWGASTRVGNGDDGTDLEGFDEIKSGPIFDSREKAVDTLKKLDIQGVPGLGILIPEVEKAQLYMAKRDVQANLDEDQGAFHADFNGAVFARTMAEPYSPTRFFPAAAKLSMDQLVALQIHEALHRALPASVRENETKVAQLTIAITSPGATYDRVKNVAVKTIPEATAPRTAQVMYMGAPLSTNGETVSTGLYPIPDNAKVKRPSVFAYTYQSFSNKDDGNMAPIQSMHTIQSYLYPFGSDENPIGIGIEASVLKFENTTSKLGPLGLSVRERLWSTRGFDIGGWAAVSLNTLSAEELKNSPYGRDVFSFGFSSRKDIKNFYVENLLGYTTGGQVKQKVANVTYTHDYGAVVNATVKAGLRLGHVLVGGYGELLLADNYRFSGPGFPGTETGRYQVLGAGPDIGWEQDWWAVRVFGRYVVESTQDADFTTLGNVLGNGAGQGSIGAQLSVVF